MNRWFLLFYVFGFMATACGREHRFPGNDQAIAFTPLDKTVIRNHYSLLLVVVDTLRADHLGAYGYGAPTSPVIDRAANRGYLFENLVSAAPWTAPAFGTILTGSYPQTHRVGMVVARGKGGRRVKGFYLEELSPAVKTGASIFRAAGLSTFAVVSNPFLHPVLGFARGFENYDYQVAQRLAEKVVDIALKRLEAVGQKRFFGVVHFMDPHTPYAPLKKWRDRFFNGSPGRLTWPFHLKRRKVLEMSLTSGELDFVQGLYDGEIRQTDEQIGRLLAGLTRLGLDERTFVVITADHGEEFLEHGGFYHGEQMFGEVTHVPLIIVPPKGVSGRGRIGSLACQVDLLPTIGALLGVGKKIGEGRSLVGQMQAKKTGTEPEYRRAAHRCFIEAPLVKLGVDDQQSGRRRHMAVVEEGRKLVASEDGQRMWGFDYAFDPTEQFPQPAAGDKWKTLRKLLQQRLANQRRRRHSHGAQLPGDVTGALKKMGYLE